MIVKPPLRQRVINSVNVWATVLTIAGIVSNREEAKKEKRKDEDNS
jgi:hypothetical protein